MDAEPHELPPAEPIENDAGGDPACWAALVCPNCGAMPDSPEQARATGRCARCGELYPVEG